MPEQAELVWRSRLQAKPRGASIPVPQMLRCPWTRLQGPEALEVGTRYFDAAKQCMKTSA